MSLSTIRQISRDCAIRACRENKIPFVYEQEDIDDLKAQLKAGKRLRFLIPHLGDYLPQGWRYTDREPLFIDISGYGKEDEPAMTTRAFLEALTPGKGYGCVECGQFQAHIREYERDDSSEGNADEYVGLTSQEEAEAAEIANPKGPDVHVTFEGSIALFWLRTQRARQWIGVHVADPTWCGRALVVEQRFVKELTRGMKADRLRIA